MKPNLDSRHQHKGYAGMIESVDENIGRLMRKLETSGLAQDTFVVFFSDNGGLVSVTSNSPLRGGKGVLYEGGIREPLIMYWLGTIKPGVCSTPVIGTDFYPTFLELAGLSQPGGYDLDGKSLVPLIFGREGKEQLEDRPLFWHFPNYMIAQYMGFLVCMVHESGFILMSL